MATSIPLVQTTDRNINQLQQNIVQGLKPLLSNPENFGLIIKSVSLVPGNNTISHGLGQALQGWSIIRKRAQCSPFDLQDSNTSPSTTLILFSDAASVVDLYVF